METKTMFNWNDEMLKPFMDVYWQSRGGRKMQTKSQDQGKITSSPVKTKKVQTGGVITAKTVITHQPDII